MTRSFRRTSSAPATAPTKATTAPTRKISLSPLLKLTAPPWVRSEPARGEGEPGAQEQARGGLIGRASRKRLENEAECRDRQQPKTGVERRVVTDALEPERDVDDQRERRRRHRERDDRRSRGGGLA